MKSPELESGWLIWRATVLAHLRVVGALVRREMQVRGGHSRLGYLWVVIEPMLHLVLYLLLFKYVLKRHSPLGGSESLFLLTGIVPYFFFSKMAMYVCGAVAANRSLLNLPPVKLIDVVLARVVLESATYLFVSFVTFSGLYLAVTAEAAPYDPLAVIQACTLCVFLGLGIGTINLVIASYVTNWMAIFGLASFPLWFFSGIWFQPEQVPQPFRDYMLYNPVLHIVMWFRTGFYRDFKAVFLDPAYVVGVAFLTVTLGLALMQLARRKLLEPQ